MKPKEYKLVILVSGGIDSTIAYFYAQKELGYRKEDILCLYINLNHPYAWKEKEALTKIGIPFKEININLIREEFGNIPKPVHPYSIILNRNVLFAVIGSMFGERVWITALEDEMHKFALERDKSPEFYLLTSALLTYTSSIRRNKTIIETPFEKMTKTEVIRWALDNDVPEEIIKATNTCYNGKKTRCGKCFVCFKRWVAMTLNDIEEDYSFPPYKSKEALRLVTEYKKAWDKQDFSHYHKKRVSECFEALKKAGVIIKENGGDKSDK